MLIEALLPSAGAIFLAELGDKTMLATMCFSAQCRRPSLVLLASIAALTSSTILAIVAGMLMAATLPLELIFYLSGAIFIIMGIYMLGSLRTESGATYQSTSTFLGIFSLVFVSELGDKTQLACLVLAAESPFPILVFIGAMIGFFVVNSIGAVAGRGIAGAVPLRLIRGATAAVFIVVGVLIVLRIL